MFTPRIGRTEPSRDPKSFASGSPGTYSLELRNILPGLGQRYRIFVGPGVRMEQPRLTTSEQAPFTLGGEGRSCTDADSARGDLRRATDESQIPDLERKVHQALARCDDELMRRIDVGREIVTNRDTPVTVGAGSRTSITIVRDSKRWEVTLSSVDRGRWQMMFGLAFAPNRDEEYFSRTEGEGKFRVAQERSPEEGTVASLPSVFWTWLPPDQAFRVLQHGPTAGIGVSTTGGLRHTALLVGYAIRYNQNMGVVLGAALHPQKRLDGRYSPNEVVTERLTADQLTQDEIQWNWFFGGIFRFGGRR